MKLRLKYKLKEWLFGLGFFMTAIFATSFIIGIVIKFLILLFK